eukprot:augustus_masked-scaffold_6-processed-gene-5.8-mRNA-1 protein AED:0.42 eAED:0.42 QI:0/0/0/0.5/1/1/2/0/816
MTSTVPEGQLAQIVGNSVVIAASGIPKPPYCVSDGRRCGEQPIDGVTQDLVYTQSNGEFFDSWYNDNKTYNRRFGTSIELSSNNGRVFRTVQEDGFFGPLNHFKSGPEAVSFDVDQIEEIKAWPQTFTGNLEHRGFWFTSEVHTTFKYESKLDMSFTFTGDNDFWAYINGRLAIDLGGLHEARRATINLNNGTYAEQLGLENGEIYTLDLFHAQRQAPGSNYRLTTSLRPSCNFDRFRSRGLSIAGGNSTEIGGLFFFSENVDFDTGRNNSFLLQKSGDTNNGSLIYTAMKQNLIRGFKLSFSVDIDDLVEGFAVVFQSDTLENYPISTGRDFNFKGIENSFAVLFDLCMSQDVGCAEKRVSIHYPDGENVGGENSASNDTLHTNDFLFGSMSSFDVEIVFYGNSPSFLEVYVDKSLYLRETNFELEAILGEPSGFIGLTTSSSSRSANIEISKWKLQLARLDPKSSKLNFNPNNIQVEEFSADGVSPCGGFGVQTRDSCGRRIRARGARNRFSATFIEVLGNERDVSGRRVYHKGRTFPNRIRGDIVDSNDGSYDIQMTSTVVGEYRLAFTFGEGCSLEVDVDEQSQEVQVPNVTFFGYECLEVDILEPVTRAVVPPETFTLSPTITPTESPSKSPTSSPSASPTQPPTLSPSNKPTILPTNSSSTSPTASPTTLQTASPSDSPTKIYDIHLTEVPTVFPTASPSVRPSRSPTVWVSSAPTNERMTYPTQFPATISEGNVDELPVVLCVSGALILLALCCLCIFVYCKKSKKESCDKIDVEVAPEKPDCMDGHPNLSGRKDARVRVPRKDRCPSV